MYKHLNELKELTYKQLNELEENSNEQMNEVKKIVANIKKEFNKDLEILQKAKMEILQMKSSVNQIKIKISVKSLTNMWNKLPIAY
jgi:SMC interacting uncharacterized protein involved in chromosome segregation